MSLTAEADLKPDVVFLDREGERDTLLSCLPPSATAPALLVVRGPTGVGKSSLTDWVTDKIAGSTLSVKVDPYLRGQNIDPHRAYEGYYIQHCVSAISESVAAPSRSIDTFAEFVRSRGLKNLKGFDVRGTVREAASVPKLVGRAIDATERVTALGGYSPEALLKSDNRNAVEVCAEYFRYVANLAEFVLVIREAQHCDTTSLRTILRCFADDGKFYPLLEYTTETRSFQKRHHVQIEQFAVPRIWDIEMLPWAYVVELLERLGHHDQKVVGEFQARWDGNLRSLDELRFRVAYGSANISTQPNAQIPHSAVDAIKERLGELGRAERLALAILREHNEPIAREAFDAIWRTVDPKIGLPLRLPDVLAGLTGSLLSVSSAQIGLNNDDVASAISGMQDEALYKTDARRLLVDHYRKIIENSAEGSVERAVALRHTTRLAALLEDPALLETILEKLDGEIESKGDPTLYVDHVIGCIENTQDLGQGERSALAAWAARHAYRSSNFGLTLAAIDKGNLEGPIWESILAHALIEELREPEAREIASAMRAGLPFADADLMSDLILGNLDLVEGQLATCERRLTQTAAEAQRRKSVLLGHAYRLLESAVPMEEAIEYCDKSAEVYERASLQRSAAQSKLTATRHLARLGRTDEAKANIQIAESGLKDAASSRQFLLNNHAAVELLAVSPDFEAAEGNLRSALLLSRDKFSDLTILQNLAIAIWQARGAREAVSSVDQALRSMREVDSTTRLLADAIGHTAFMILSEAGDHERADEAVRFVTDTVGVDIRGSEYWSWRFGLTGEAPGIYAPHVLAKPYHPSFLSQWQLDWEVASVLFQ